MEIRLNSYQMVTKDIISIWIGIAWWLHYFSVHIHPWFAFCIIQCNESNSSRKSFVLQIIIRFEFNHHDIRWGRNNFVFPVADKRNWFWTLISTWQSCKQVWTSISTINIVYRDWIAIIIWIELQRIKIVIEIILQLWSYFECGNKKRNLFPL